MVGFGGDDVILVFRGIATPEFANNARKEIGDALAPPLQYLREIAEAKHLAVGASVGVTFYPTNGKEVEALIKLAELGMPEDKAAERGEAQDG